MFKKNLAKISGVALSLMAVVAMVAANTSAGAASWFNLHQPEMPESLKK